MVAFPTENCPTDLEDSDKDAWLNQERDRWARYFDVPMIKHFPEDFPPMTLEAQRALCAINQRIPEKLLGATEELYCSIWIHGNMKVGQGAALAAVLERVLGKNDADAIIKAVSISYLDWFTDRTCHANRVTDQRTRNKGPCGLQHRPGIQGWCLWPSLVWMHQRPGQDRRILGHWSLGPGGRLPGAAAEVGQWIPGVVVDVFLHLYYTGTVYVGCNLELI